MVFGNLNSRNLWAELNMTIPTNCCGRYLEPIYVFLNDTYYSVLVFMSALNACTVCHNVPVMFYSNPNRTVVGNNYLDRLGYFNFQLHIDEIRLFAHFAVPVLLAYIALRIAKAKRK